MIKGQQFVRQVLLILSSLIILFPLLYAFLISISPADQNSMMSIIPTSVTLKNYVAAINTAPILHFILNSFIFAGLITLGHLATSSLAAFAFVFIPFKGKQFLFLVVLSTMMIPWEATIIPNYETIVNMNWINTFPGLIVPHLALTLGIFLLRQHFMTIPIEVYEAARMDGCSRLRYFLTIILPLSKSILAALGTFSFISSWNQYLWPLLVTNSNEIRTVQIGLNMLVSQEEANSYPIIMSGIIVVILPTLLILFIGHKYLQAGLVSYSQK